MPTTFENKDPKDNEEGLVAYMAVQFRGIPTDDGWLKPSQSIGASWLTNCTGVLTAEENAETDAEKKKGGRSGK